MINTQAINSSFTYRPYRSIQDFYALAWQIGGRVVAGQRALRAGAHFQQRMPHQLKSVLMRRCVEVLAKGDQRHLLDGDRLVFNLHQVGSCSLKLQGQRGLCLKQLVFSPANIHFAPGAAYYLWSTWAWKTTCTHPYHTHTHTCTNNLHRYMQMLTLLICILRSSRTFAPAYCICCIFGWNLGSAWIHTQAIQVTSRLPHPLV